MTDGWIRYYDQRREFVPGAHLGDFEPETVMVADGTVVLFGGRSDDRLPLRALDLETGVPLPDRAGLHGRRPPRAIALGRCGDRTLLATASATGVVRVRDAATGAPVGAEIHHERTGVSVAVAAVDGDDVVAVAGSAWIKAWRVADGTQLASRGYKSARFVAFQGRLLAARAHDGARELRDVLTGKAVATFSVPDGTVWTIAEIGGRLLAVAVPGTRIDGAAPWAWDVFAGEEVTLPPLTGPAADVGSVRAITVDADLTTLVTWYTEEYETRAALRLPGAQAVETVDDPVLGGGLVAVADHGNTLIVRDTATGEPIGSPFYGGAVGPPAGLTRLDGRTVAVLPGEQLMIWDVAGGRPVARLDCGLDLHRVVPDDRGRAALLYPTDGEEPRLRVLDLATGETAVDVALAPQYAGLVAAPVWVEHDGRPMLAVLEDHAITLYDAATGARHTGVFGDHSAEMFSPGVLAGGLVGDRRVLAAGCDFGGEVRIWDAGTGERLLRVDCGGLGVGAVTFGDHDGRPIMATATSTYPRIQVWDAVTGAKIGRGIDMSRRVTPMKTTAMTLTRWRGRTALLAAARDWPPFLWVIT
ncbi:WD40 repeat domain-containing protein [Actinoplanes couchii]|uniref:WD-40 repeat protein n=1 Tax=Actinoplanes couchii TaxID=403638 RepID=A0ABQ3XK80_9ACTN|nr:hypothetical protein [Actinoplanes couchii]MDR6320495.1 WD40 repeat protein [Actinoplanes couchii]GID58899.1 hypothetical protein Aco03nite_073030 [Actinoplanes couchii]